MHFRLTCLTLILVQSNGQGLARFHCEYLVNGLSKRYYCHQIVSAICAFDWHSYLHFDRGKFKRSKTFSLTSAELL